MKQSILAIAFAFLPCGAALAQWTPAWTVVVPHPRPPPVRVSAVNLRVADDGTVFAGVDSTYQNRAHAGVIRVESGGQFAWLNEREGTTLTAAGIERLSSGHLAVIGESVLDEQRSVFVRVVDGATGALVWEHESIGGRLWFNGGDLRYLAEGPDGELRLRLSDGGDFVVLRLAADGTPLAPWRANTGLALVRADEIAATADGGAVVVGAAGIAEGFVTVRFDAGGEVVFTDIEPGEIGNPLGQARVRIDAGGAAIVAASPETMGGVPGAMVWKLDAAGGRLWTVELSEQPSFATTFANGPVLMTPAGDLIVAVDDVNDLRMRAIHVRGSDGGVVRTYVSDVTTHEVLTLARAASGRVLLGGFQHIPGSGGQVASRLVELDADGQLCRSVVDTEPSATLAVEWAPDGWSVLRAGNALEVRRYDADGACVAGAGDVIFVDGFEIVER